MKSDKSDLRSDKSGFFSFESTQDKIIFFGIAGTHLILGSLAFYPTIIGSTITRSAVLPATNSGVNTGGVNNGIAKAEKTSAEYYSMFQCSCCGRPIDADCCGMAKQRKEYLDGLVKEGLDENELVYKMVKKFGFDVLMDPSREQEVRDYMRDNSPENPPRIEIINPQHDLGTISQSDGIVTTSFKITNVGESDLIIENMDTSCMCTTARLVYNGKESPEFGMSMHGNNPDNYELVIPPGDSAELKVYYDPMAHGIQKKSEIMITREVTIISNDPVDFQKKVRIRLTQVP
jgi:hypothetical protein